MSSESENKPWGWPVIPDEPENDLPGFGREVEEAKPWGGPVGADGLNGYGRMMKNNHRHNTCLAIRAGERIDPSISRGRSRAELLRAMLKGEWKQVKAP